MVDRSLVDSVGEVDCVGSAVSVIADLVVDNVGPIVVRSAASVAAVESAGFVVSTGTAGIDSVGVVDGLGAVDSAGVGGSGVEVDSSWLTTPVVMVVERVDVVSVGDGTADVEATSIAPDAVSPADPTGFGLDATVPRSMDGSAASTVAPAGTELSVSNTKVPAEPAPRSSRSAGRTTNHPMPTATSATPMAAIQPSERPSSS